MNPIKASYHWFNEPSTARLKLDDVFREKLVKKATDSIGSLPALARKSRLSKNTISNYLYGKGMSVGGLKSILDVLNMNYLDVEKHVIGDSYKKINFPVKLNSEDAAIFLAAILGDGSNTTKVMYKNKDKVLINKVEAAAINLFGDISIEHRVSQQGIPYINFSRIVGRVLVFVGIPLGKHIQNDSGVPKVILYSRKNIQKHFLQQFFDDEGWPQLGQPRIAVSQCVDCTALLPTSFFNFQHKRKVYYIKDIRKDLRKRLKPPRILKDIKEIFSHIFGIYSTYRFKRVIVYKTKKATALWELEIIRKEDIKKFYKEINFHSALKKEKLELLVKDSLLLPENITCLILNKAIELSKSEGYFRANVLAERLGFPQRQIRKRLLTLVKKGLFSKDSKGRYFSNIIIPK